MKEFFVAILLLFSILSIAQKGYVAPVAVGAPLQGGRAMDMNVTSRAIDVSKFNGIAGTPFLSNDYQQAFVKTKSGGQFGNVWVKFNTYGNEILLENRNQLVALEGVDSVAYTDKSEPGTDKNVILKTGYPAIEDKTGETIYQVLAHKPAIQLLKYYQTKVENVKTMGMPDKKTFVITPVYFVFMPEKKTLKKVKLNKSLLDELKEFPEAKAKAAGVNLRNEKEVIKLISSL